MGSVTGQSGRKVRRMRLIEEANHDYESCAACVHSDDSEEICVLRRCIHAVSRLKECYVPKSPAIEPERKNGKWIDDEGNAVTTKYCATCPLAVNGANT